MEINIENLKSIPAGDTFAVFKNNTLHSVWKMLAGQHFVQLQNGMLAVTPEIFVKNLTTDIKHDNDTPVYHTYAIYHTSQIVAPHQ